MSYITMGDLGDLGGRGAVKLVGSQNSWLAARAREAEEAVQRAKLAAARVARERETQEAARKYWKEWALSHPVAYALPWSGKTRPRFFPMKLFRGLGAYEPGSIPWGLIAGVGAVAALLWVGAKKSRRRA